VKHQVIDDRERVWVVTLGPDGQLQDELDPLLLAGLSKAQSAHEIAEALAMADGRRAIAETRAW
jgi:hypothetical protein